MRVPASARIGGAGTGWGTWHETMLDGIVLLAAQAVGGARYALDITVQYAKDREQFGKPLGAFQAIAHYLADAVDRGRRRRDARVRGGVGPRQRTADRAARADGEAVRVQDLPRRHRHGPAGVRRGRASRSSTTSSCSSGGPSSSRSRGGTTAGSRSSSRRPCSIECGFGRIPVQSKLDVMRQHVVRGAAIAAALTLLAAACSSSSHQGDSQTTIPTSTSTVSTVEPATYRPRLGDHRSTGTPVDELRRQPRHDPERVGGDDARDHRADRTADRGADDGDVAGHGRAGRDSAGSSRSTTAPIPGTNPFSRLPRWPEGVEPAGEPEPAPRRQLHACSRRFSSTFGSRAAVGVARRRRSGAESPPAIGIDTVDVPALGVRRGDPGRCRVRLPGLRRTCPSSRGPARSPGTSDISTAVSPTSTGTAATASASTSIAARRSSLRITAHQRSAP